MFHARRNVEKGNRHPWHLVVMTAIALSASTSSLAQSDFAVRVEEADESAQINMYFVEEDIRACIEEVSVQAPHTPIILGPRVSGSVTCGPRT